MLHIIDIATIVKIIFFFDEWSSLSFRKKLKSTINLLNYQSFLIKPRYYYTNLYYYLWNDLKAILNLGVGISIFFFQSVQYSQQQYYLCWIVFRAIYFPLAIQKRFRIRKYDWICISFKFWWNYHKENYILILKINANFSYRLHISYSSRKKFSDNWDESKRYQWCHFGENVVHI